MLDEAGLRNFLSDRWENESRATAPPALRAARPPPGPDCALDSRSTLDSRLSKARDWVGLFAVS